MRTETCFRAMFLWISTLALAACAKPAPLPMGAPAYSFRALPPVAITAPLNPSVTLAGAFEIIPTQGRVLGSLSDLQLFPQAGGSLRAEAVADWGAVVTFTLKGTAETGFVDTPADIYTFLDETGKPFTNKAMSDAEDLAFDPISGDRFISFEGIQRVLRFGADKGFGVQGEMLPLKGLPPFPHNEGMEGLAFVRDDAGRGTLLIGVESGGFYACDVGGDYACRQTKGPPVPGLLYKLVSLAPLEPGQTGPTRDILALYRYYDPISGPRGQLSRLVWDGAELKFAEALFSLTPPVPIDNYESIAPVKTATGYRLYLISDVLKRGTKPHLVVLDWVKK